MPTIPLIPLVPVTARDAINPSRRTLLAGLLALASSNVLRAQEAAPLRILTGFPAGSIVDLMARALAEALQRELARPVLVDSRPGASGRLAVEAAKAAAADGETLLLVPHGAMTLFPHVFPRLRYDPARDFQPLAQLAEFDFALAASPALPVKTLQDLRGWLKDHPQQASYGSPGTGTVPHFLGERCAELLGLPLVHVPFKSPGEMVAALMGNQVPLVFTPIGDLLEGERAGRLRILATTGAVRAAQTPQVPTFKEGGLDLQQRGWMGLYSVAGVPAATAARLEAAALRALQQPGVQQALRNANLSPVGRPGVQLVELQAAESRAWADIVRRSGFKPES